MGIKGHTEGIQELLAGDGDIDIISSQTMLSWRLMNHYSTAVSTFQGILFSQEEDFRSNV
jgi:hypothetical protein